MVPALGVEDGQARADLLGEAEQVELGAELAVVAPLGLLQLVQVGGQRLLRLPRRPVDALELLALLVAAPVGTGDPHQLEVAQPARRGHVRAPAQVDEGVGVPVGADHRAAGVDLVRPPTHGLDDLLLEGLVGEDLEPLLQRRARGGRRAGPPCMMARISASIRSRSSSLKWAPSGSSKS